MVYATRLSLKDCGDDRLELLETALIWSCSFASSSLAGWVAGQPTPRPCFSSGLGITWTAKQKGTRQESERQYGSLDVDLDDESKNIQ